MRVNENNYQRYFKLTLTLPIIHLIGTKSIQMNPTLLCTIGLLVSVFVVYIQFIIYLIVTKSIQMDPPLLCVRGSLISVFVVYIQFFANKLHLPWESTEFLSLLLSGLVGHKNKRISLRVMLAIRGQVFRFFLGV